jgi:hypothetical protein
VESPRRDDPEESSWPEAAVTAVGAIHVLTEGRIQLKPRPFPFGFTLPVLTERERFIAAFEAILARGETPTPGRLNREQGFNARRQIPGRLSGLRRELLLAAGFVQGPSTGGSLGRWKRP